MVNSESESDSEQELDTEYEDVSTLQEKEMQDPKLHKEEKCEKVETQSPASGHGSDEKGFDENSALVIFRALMFFFPMNSMLISESFFFSRFRLRCPFFLPLKRRMQR